MSLGLSLFKIASRATLEVLAGRIFDTPGLDERLISLSSGLLSHILTD